ncbi:MAG: cytochrome c-type biogenesis CcmF C-terminal domain-containing protein, partial [Candidatus Kryptoniota bacterium]
SSLVPWLFSAAALHTILIGRRTGGYLKTSLFLSVTSFVLVLYSTFLTRSGVLGDTSVHAFVDPGREVYILLLVFIGTFLILGYVPLIKYRALIPSVGVGHNLLSRENALFIGAASLSVLSLFVLVGTSSPIITGLLQGKPTAVDSSYYVTTSLPLGFLIITLIGFAQIVWWDKSDKKAFRKNMFLPLAGTIVTAVVALLLSVTQISVILIISAAMFAFIAHTTAMLRIVKGNPRYIGGPIAHAGIALIFVGVVTSTALESKVTVQLPEGKPVKAYGHEFVYSSNIQVDGKDGFLVKMPNGKNSSSLRPVMYYSDYNQGTMREPDIKSYFGYDLYLSPVSLQNENLNGNSGGVNLITLVKNKPTKLDDGTVLILKGFKMIGGEHSTMEMQGSFGVSALIDAVNDGKKIEIAPELQFVNGQQKGVPAEAFGNVLAIMDMNVGMGGGEASVRVVVHSQDISSASIVPILTVEISRKPLISFLWGGTVILFIGLIISLYRRFNEESVALKFSSVTISAKVEKEAREDAEVHT